MTRLTPKPFNMMFHVSAVCFACTFTGMKAFKKKFLYLTGSVLWFVLFVISLQADCDTILPAPALALSRSHPSMSFIPPVRAFCVFHHYKSWIVYKYIPTWWLLPTLLSGLVSHL